MQTYIHTYSLNTYIHIAKEAAAAGEDEQGAGQVETTTARTRHQPRRARAEVDYKALNDEVEADLQRKRVSVLFRPLFG
jgi:hypothetical protein